MNEALKKIQKETRLKQGAYDSEKNRLYYQGLTLLKMLKLYIKQVEEAKMINESFFIDWEDSLNELSIKDHNADPE